MATSTHTFAELSNIAHALKALQERRLPGRVAYAVARTAQRIESITTPIDKLRNELVERYAARDDAGAMIRTVVELATGKTVGPYVEGAAVASGNIVTAAIADEHREALAAAMTDLNAEAHTLEAHTFSIDTLGDVDIEPWIIALLLDNVITTPDDDHA